MTALGYVQVSTEDTIRLCDNWFDVRFEIIEKLVRMDVEEQAKRHVRGKGWFFGPVTMEQAVDKVRAGGVYDDYLWFRKRTADDVCELRQGAFHAAEANIPTITVRIELFYKLGEFDALKRGGDVNEYVRETYLNTR
jgi:hypothetical protein